MAHLPSRLELLKTMPKSDVTNISVKDAKKQEKTKREAQEKIAKEATEDMKVKMEEMGKIITRDILQGMKRRI